MYTLVGSIGFSPHPLVWAEFTRWIRTLPDNYDASTPGLVTSEWWHKLDKRHIWTQHFIFFCVRRGLRTLYQRMPDGTALAVHQREKGANFAKSLGADFPTRRRLPRASFSVSVRSLDWDGFPIKRAFGFDPITQATLLNRAASISNSNAFVYLLFTNDALVEMTKNWICNVQKLQPDILHHVLIITESYATVEQLSAFDPTPNYLSFILLSVKKQVLDLIHTSGLF